MVSIRTATQEDSGSISRVHIDSWRTTYRGIVPDPYLAGLNAEHRTILWREILNAKALVLLAEQGGEVVGFIHGGPIREPLGGCDAELYAIYLLLKAQNNRLGTALLIELAKHLDADGFQSMVVQVLEASGAVGFYVRSGAVRVATKEVQLGGRMLPVVVYMWPSLKTIANLCDNA